MSALKKGLSKFKNGIRDDETRDPSRSHSHSPLSKLRSKLSASSNEDAIVNGDEGLSKNQQKKEAKREEHAEKKKLNEEHQQEEEKQRKEDDERAAREEPNEMRARYGTLPVNQSKDWKHEKRLDLGSLAAVGVSDEEVTFRARVSTLRRMSARLVFILFRMQEWTVQGVLEETDGLVSTHFVRWAEHISLESIVLVKGTLVKAKEEVRGASIHDAEIAIRELHIISEPTDSLPFNVYEADITNGEIERDEPRRQNVSDRTRLANRIIDLRTSTSQSVFRINAGICSIFRSYLDSIGFTEIHTPKLQGGATESGSSVFQVEYFGRPAFLAQSPQLAKQMCVSADFEKVYEVGPVFRAENSNTHRHLTEYTGLDLEMAIEEHYHEALQVIDEMFKQVWKGIYARHQRELEVIKRQFPHENLVWLDETPTIPFKEGIQMLREAGWTDDEGNPLSEHEDLGTRDEIRLGELVKEKYHTDYYILDKFPASARPFYTMPDPEDPQTTNSFDIFLRGQEILSGGQRIHNAKMLDKQIRKMHIQQEGMEEYLEGFAWGAPPHAGGGIGLERVLMLLLGLENIRLASLFHRDPKSLVAKAPPCMLRHTDASTLHPPWEIQDVNGDREFQPLEKLIANYGDATNTSYLEDRTQIWRCENSGAVIGYVPIDGFAIILGNPLCEKIQYGRVIVSFLRYLRTETNLKPLWILCGHEVEDVLGSKLNWKTLTCVAEQRTDLTKNTAEQDKDMQRKTRHAEKEGVKITSVPLGETVPKDVQQQCGQRLEDWLAGRKGTQVHLSQLKESKVFQDMEHRWYFYACDSSGTICALVVLAQLSLEHGYQVKYSVDFPDAPSGTIEYITLHALQAAKDAGVKKITFGGGATDRLSASHGINGMHVKILKRSYRAIASSLKLTQKSQFRQKLGAEEDPIYVCHPKHGMGPMGIHAIMKFLGADE